jgi:torulene dioxygenase
VFYRSRRTSDKYIEGIQRAGRAPISFGQQDLCDSFFHKFFTKFWVRPIADSASKNIAVTLTTNFPAGPKLTDSSHRDKSGAIRNLYVKTDTNQLHELDPETLDVVEGTTYNALLPGAEGMSSASHAAVDPDTGELFNFLSNYGRKITYTLFKLTPPTKNAPAGHKILATITDAPAAYIHSVCLTKRYFIFCVWQADLKFNGATILYNRNMAQSFSAWNPNRKTLWYVIDRDAGGIVRKYQSDPFFAFHHINSFDDGDDVVVDLATYESHEVIDSLYLDKLRSTSATKGRADCDIPWATRVVLKDVTASTTPGTAITTRTLTTIELPTISTSYSGRPNRYAYGVSSLGISSLWDSIVKIDLNEIFANPTNPPEGSVKRFSLPKCTPSEPIFVPRPGGTSEDDGVVLTVELDGVKGRSALVVVDAMSFEEVGRAELAGDGFVVPHGFHGTWYSNL